MKQTIHAQQQYNEIVNKLKKLYQVQFVANPDLCALSRNFEHIGAGDFHNFKREVVYSDIYYPEIRAFNGVRVLCISFKELAEHFNPFFKKVTGKNRIIAYDDFITCEDGDYYLDDNLILCLTDEQRKNLAANYESGKQAREEMNHFHTSVKPLMNSEKLGESFEIGETVADYFLNCMPPFFGKGCFLMGEPYSSTPEGENIYYCFRKSGNTHTIEFNTVSNCK